MTVTQNSITRIEVGGKVLTVMDSMNLEETHMFFEDSMQVIHLNPGDSFTAVCKVKGMVDQYGMGFGFTLVFEGCWLVATN